MERRIVKRYSTAFKMKVVSELESGELSVAQAQRRYGLGEGSTIYTWLKRYGRHYQKPILMRIQDPKEVDRTKQLEKEKKELESALAAAHLTILRLESTIEVASEMYGVDLKKKFDKEASSAAFTGEKRPRRSSQ